MQHVSTHRLAYLAEPGLRHAVLRQAAAGAIGGFLVFILLEPVRRAGGGYGADLFDGISDLYMPGILFGGIVTALLVAAEELFAGSWLRLCARTLASALAGAVLGAGYSVIGQTLFDALRETLPGSALLARSLGWAIFGLGTGLSAGIASNSGQRAYQGCAGGLVGGFLAGWIFALIPEILGAGTLRLFSGFLILGTAVGVATALFEHLSRSVWLTFLSGPREGQDLLLYRDPTILGRSELVDVPLFGDLSVDRRHATLYLYPLPRIEQVGLGADLTIDGQPVRFADLRDGNVIGIGKHRLRFHHHEYRHAPPKGPVPPTAIAFEHLIGTPGAPPAPAPGGTMGSVLTANAPGFAAPVNGSPTATLLDPEPGPLAASPAGSSIGPPSGLLLRVVCGPGVGAVVPLAGEAVTLGRDSDCTVPIKAGNISRNHARIDCVDGYWLLTDLGSTNGTWLNGLRVNRAGLEPGDRIEVGGTTIRVESIGTGAERAPW